MSPDIPAAVDAYFSSLLVPEDPRLDGALERAVDAGLPPIQVSPLQGKLLALLTRFGRARRVLEIGTLGGYSALWMGDALPEDGRLVSLEVDPDRAEVARDNWDRAGLAERIEVRVGPALETLAEMKGEEPFDLVFLDADKENNPAYLEALLNVTRPGSLIVADNVVRGGEILDASGRDPKVAGLRRFHEMIAADPRLFATALQTTGSKGHDGFVLILVGA